MSIYFFFIIYISHFCSNYKRVTFNLKFTAFASKAAATLELDCVSLITISYFLQNKFKQNLYIYYLYTYTHKKETTTKNKTSLCLSLSQLLSVKL